MYLTLIAGALFSALYLYEKKSNYDVLGRAFLYVATFFSTVVLVSGPIWAKPIWGVYWTWDPRLTTSFLVFVLLVGYCFVRNLFDNTAGRSTRGATIGAILAILAVIDIPLIHFSVKLWRGVHPSVLRNPEGLPESYRTGLEAMILSTFLLAFLMVWITYKILVLSSRTKESKNV
jgi:heme exporter protein C